MTSSINVTEHAGIETEEVPAETRGTAHCMHVPTHVGARARYEVWLIAVRGAYVHVF